MDIEKVTDLDKAKILGYFETIKSVFFTKWLLLIKHSNGKKLIINADDNFKEVFKDFKHFSQYIKALNNGNNELLLNFQEDIGTTLLISSWSVFELIIKDLAKTDYALASNDISTDYHKNIFGLTDREKKNLDLFYYIRNAIVHYNGAYYAYREIDHVYEEFRYFSKGQEGTKIDFPSMAVAFNMHVDIENYAHKAWENYHKYKNII